MNRNRIGRNYQAVIERAKALGISFDADVDTLTHSELTWLADSAKAAGYRAPSTRNGSTGRYFFAMLQRLATR